MYDFGNLTGGEESAMRKEIGDCIAAAPDDVYVELHNEVAAANYYETIESNDGESVGYMIDTDGKNPIEIWQQFAGDYSSAAPWCKLDGYGRLTSFWDPRENSSVDDEEIIDLVINDEREDVPGVDEVLQRYSDISEAREEENE